MTTAKKADNLASLAELVAVGWSIRDASQEIGLSENAAYKLSGTPEFKSKVSAIRTQKTEGISASALGASADAIRELQTIATTAERDSDRIAACKVILSQVLPFAEHTELRRRLDELEQRATEATGEAGGKQPDALSE